MIKKAVALAYPENVDAPFISASEKGSAAEKLVRIAKENNIPIVSNTDLVEVLSAKELGSCVPEETWQVLANIFAFIATAEKT